MNLHEEPPCWFVAVFVCAVLVGSGLLVIHIEDEENKKKHFTEEQITVFVDENGVLQISAGESTAPQWCFMDVYENGDVHDANFYNLSKDGKFHSSYEQGTDGQFTSEKASEVWTMFKAFDRQKYEPYHANEDGLMVTEYLPYTVKVLFDKSDYEWHQYEQTKNNYSKERCKYYALTEEDYNELISQFEKMQNAVEKQNEKE